MKKKFLIVIYLLIATLIGIFSWNLYFKSTPFDASRKSVDTETITELPKFPSAPITLLFLGKKKENEYIKKVVDHKLTTYPQVSSRPYRIGKFTSTGIFGSFEPTEDQIAQLAPHYDNILFTASQKDLIPRFKKYNPALSFLLYIDSGLNPEFARLKAKADVGSIDEEDAFWIVKNHSDWLLKDEAGIPIQAGKGGPSYPGMYFPDPGNKEWQNFYAEKVNKLIQETGGKWNGVLFDQLLGTVDGHERYSNAPRQSKYKTDEEFQNIQINFFETVRKKIKVPIIANIDGIAVSQYPEFFGRIAVAAGGAESETFPEEMPIEDLQAFLKVVNKIPKDKHIRINSKPSPEWSGNIDKTLFAYYSYLLFADRDREAYWTFKEGTSDIPHYWFREFDLNLGNSLGDMKQTENIFTREFENAIIVVNGGNDESEYKWNPNITYFDIKRKRLTSPIVLQPRTAMLITKNPQDLIK